MWRLTKVRKAKIPDDLREKFSLLGEHVVAMALAGTISASSAYLKEVYSNRVEAIAWLRERRDIQARREYFRDIVGIAILVFIVFGVIIDFVFLIRQLLFG
jgi:hypothetical protein